MMQNGVNMDGIGGQSRETENGWHLSSPIWEVSMFTSFLINKLYLIFTFHHCVLSLTHHLRIYSILFLHKWPHNFSIFTWVDHSFLFYRMCCSQITRSKHDTFSKNQSFIFI